ncbi:MAG: DUF1343 domain-containing protein [Candidatus Neomarinimicrobiota bacterium]
MKIIITALLLTGLLPAQEHPSIHQEHQEKYGRNDTPRPAVVLSGLDVLITQQAERLKGRNIALVTNNSGIDKQGTPNYRLLMNIKSTRLKVIFSPEHGLFGEAAAGEQVQYDSIEELPQVISLYGQNRKPTAKMLAGVDLIIYDIQDVGARYYTYISTLGLILEAGAEQNIPVWVLDRPNPIRGDRIEGPLLDLTYRSFVGYYPIPVAYGLTVGELARMIVGEGWITGTPQLEIIPMQGWSPNLWYDETGLPWVKPSPNIPDLETAIIYPGLCLVEGINVNEGRGTYQPFKKIGAPWIEEKKLAQALNDLQLPGIVFKPIRFTPVGIAGMSDNPKFKNQNCGGVEILLTDRSVLNSVATGVLVLATIHSLYPEQLEYNRGTLARLWGSDTLPELIDNLKLGGTISWPWEDSTSDDYQALVKKYQLYSEPVSK